MQKEVSGAELSCFDRFGTESAPDGRRACEVSPGYCLSSAHKHVPLMGEGPCETFKNDAFSTYNATKVTDRYRTKWFIPVRADKAENQTNIMGASGSVKR